MLQSIRINNFRGVGGLEINGLARINIFVGANGSGKTSALEAIGMVSTPGNPHFLIALASFRDMVGLNAAFDYPLRAYFPAMDPKNTIDIRARNAQGEIGLTVLSYQGGQTATKISSSDGVNPFRPAGGIDEVMMTGVRWEYRDADQTLHAVDAALVPQGFQAPQLVIPDSASAFFLQARRSNSVAETAQALTDLLAARREAELYDVVKAVDPRLRSLVSGLKGSGSVSIPVVLADVGEASLFPIQTLGDGFCRACLIATGLATRGCKTVLVDEIDSGLHFSVMQNFWKSIDRLCTRTGVQLFCTTHSEEMLRYAVAAFENSTDHLRVFRIDRNGTGTATAQLYDHHLMTVSEEAGIEVR